MPITMTENVEEVDVLETEQSDAALEKRMKKLESEATRVLKASSELLKSLNKEPAPQEATQPESSAPANPEELNKPEQAQS
jgi:arsenate reductase-like glutaredoxin family protein